MVAGAPQEPYLLTLLRAIGRRWRLVLTCTLLAPAAALGVSLLQPKEYSASASLLFRDPGFDQTLFGSSFFSPTVDPARVGATNIELVSLAAISRLTARKLGGLTPRQVERKIDVRARSNADVVTITAVDRDRRRAATIANVYAQEYVSFRRRADRAQIRDARQLLQRQLAGIAGDEQGGSRASALQQRAQDLQVLAALQTGNAELVQRATAPARPSSPRPRRNMAIGGLLGVLLGAGLALVLDRADRRIRTADQAADLLDLPLLTVIPRSRALRQGSRARPAERERVPFQMLRTNLRYFNVDRPLTSVVITSASPGDGKSTVAWNLATVSAKAGQKVLLLEADLRNPSLHGFAGRSRAGGLSDVLAGDHELMEAIRSVPLDEEEEGSTLDVLFAGHPPPNPGQLIESDAMNQVMAEAEAEYDLLVIDTPPTSIVSDAIPIINRVSGVVLVVRVGKNTRHRLEALGDQLQNLRARMLGIVANDVLTRADGYYSYGYEADRAKAAATS